MQILNIHEVDDVRLDETSVPEPGPKDVVIDVKNCGICGSDLTYIKMGGIYRQPGGVTPIGHEASGVISFVGDEVKDIEIGQRVVVNPMTTPSFIGSGGPEGAFTQKLRVRDALLGVNILPIDDKLPFEIAAMAEPLSVAMHSVNRAEVSPGDKVVVFGCGPIGLGMVLWLADRGITDLVAIDLFDERLERAKEMGASHVINPKNENVRDRLAELHGTEQLFAREAVGTDAYIDAAGAPSITSDVVRMAKFQSRLVVTAAHREPVPLDLGAMLTTEMTITTALGYPTEMPEVVAALPRLQNKIATLISHRMPLDEVLDGLKLASTPESAKVMIDIG